MPRIFISYSRKYEAFARRLATSLSHVGADIWLDITDIPAGMNWSNAIQEGLDAADLMIVVLTPESATSKNVENEWQYYLDENKPVIPILLFPTKVHFQLRRLQYVDFHSQDYDTAFWQLHSELRRRGVQLAPLTGVQVPAQSPLPTLEDKPPPGTPPVLVIGVASALVVVLIALLIIVSQRPPVPSTAPAPTIQSGAVVSPDVRTDTPISSSDASGIQTPSATPCITLTPISTPRPGIDMAITINEEWTPLVRNLDGVDMVLVPIGSFKIGSRGGSGENQPDRLQCFYLPFWIDRTEVTNFQFNTLKGNVNVDEPSNRTGNNRPRESIDWLEADYFCKNKRKGRLPTEAEWEYAARGPDNLIYPWGDVIDQNAGVFKENSGDETADVGSRPLDVSWVGALDMSGNVREWTHSIYKDYPYDANDGREADSGDAVRVARGGAYDLSGGPIMWRGGVGGLKGSKDTGFRCARNFSESDLTPTP